MSLLVSLSSSTNSDVVENNSIVSKEQPAAVYNVPPIRLLPPGINALCDPVKMPARLTEQPPQLPAVPVLPNNNNYDSAIPDPPMWSYGRFPSYPTYYDNPMQTTAPARQNKS